MAFLVLLRRSFAFNKCSTVHSVIMVINTANQQCDKNIIDFISFETGCEGNIRKYACKQVVHSFFSSFFFNGHKHVLCFQTVLFVY